jgi:hypothetical protein
MGGGRVVVEVSVQVHRELRRLAVLNDLKLYELVEGLLVDALADEVGVRGVVRRLKRGPTPQG